MNDRSAWRVLVFTQFGEASKEAGVLAPMGDGKASSDSWFRSSGCKLFENRGCMAGVGDADEHERRIGGGLEAAVCIIDVDSGVA